MVHNITEQFNIIYEKLYPSVLAYFRRRIEYDEAEDLAQITFMKLWAYLPCTNNVRKAKSLVFSIAKNVYCDRMRRKKLQETADDQQLLELSDNLDFTKQIELQMMINSLPDKDKELIELRQLGWSSREIGKVQGVSASAIRSRLQVLRKKLNNLLDI